MILPGNNDRDGRVLLHMKPALYFPNQTPVPELMCSVVYLLERAIDESVNYSLPASHTQSLHSSSWIYFHG